MFINILPYQTFMVWDMVKGGIKKREIDLSKFKTYLNYVSQTIAFAVVVLIMPLYPITHKTQSVEPQIIFDRTSPSALKSPEAVTKIVRKEEKVIVQKTSSPKTTESLDPFRFRPVYMAAADQFNVPWQLIEAVHQVESGKSGSTAKQSYAGATGPMQFMPGTWRAYAIDGNGDGIKDITDVTDAIYSAAHYLAKSGADEGRIHDAVFNYNHSQSYVNTVVSIAMEIGYSPATN